MFLQIRAHARQGMADSNAMGLEIFRRTDAGELQQLRGIERTRRKDHLALASQVDDLPVGLGPHAHAAIVVEDQRMRL